MSGGRPAPLEGSLLARKGDAVPAIPDESPLVVQLDEHRDANDSSADSVEPVPKLVGERISGGDSVDAEDPRTRKIPLQSARWVRWIAVAAAAVLAGLILWLLSGSPDSVAESSEGLTTEVPKSVVAATDTQKLHLNLETAPNSVSTEESPEQPSAGPIAQTLPAAAALLSDTTTESLPGQSDKSFENASPSILPVRLTPQEPVSPATDVELPAELNAELPKAVSPVPVPKAKPDLVRGAYGVQLASIPIEASAKQEAFRLQKLLAAVLGDKEIRVEQATVSGKGTMYRLRADGFASNTEARATCARVAEFKVSCLAFRR